MNLLTVPNVDLATARELEAQLEATVPAPLSVSLVADPENDARWHLEALYELAPELTGLCYACQGASREAMARATISPLPKIDWVQRSYEGLPPVQVGRFFVHGRHDRQTRPVNAIAIEIEAGLAFGSGHHATTRGCLVALDYLLKREKPTPVLDLGCGSGVLAIAAARATRHRVIASDVDSIAVAQTRINAQGNIAGPLVATIIAAGTAHPAIAAAAPYRLVIANILAGPLKTLAPSIARLVARNGHVILSGFTQAQEPRMLSAYGAQGIRLKRRWRLDGWSTLLFGR